MLGKVKSFTTENTEDTEFGSESQSPHPFSAKNVETRVGHPILLRIVIFLGPKLDTSIRLPMAAVTSTQGRLSEEQFQIRGRLVGQLITRRLPFSTFWHLSLACIVE
jgi:hypothetical protein